MLTACKRYSER